MISEHLPFVSLLSILTAGATIVSRPEDIKESHVGTKCGLFEIRKIGDEEFAYMEKCVNPKACSIILRGGSKGSLRSLSPWSTSHFVLLTFLSPVFQMS